MTIDIKSTDTFYYALKGIAAGKNNAPIYGYVEKSGNAKTGKIPVTMSGKQTCPKTCEFKGNGCYAENFPLSLHWNRITDNKGITFTDMVYKIALSSAPVWRLNSAGDLPNIGGTILSNHVKALCIANAGRKGFAYTHHKPTPANIKIVRRANQAGFAINFSANNVEEADKLASLNAGPVVVTLPANAPHELSHTPEGRPVIVCPAVKKNSTVTCETCALCAKSDRKSIVGFPVHGARKKAAEKVINWSK